MRQLYKSVRGSICAFAAIELLAAVLSSSLAMAQPKAVDTVGMRLGMSLQEINAAVARHDAALEVVSVEQMAQPGVPAAFTTLYAWARGLCSVGEGGSRTCKRTPPELLAVKFGRLTGRAYQVAREVNLSTPVKADELFAALKAKYGAYEAGDATTLMWGWDREGRPDKHCHISPQLPSHSGAPTEINYRCGVGITAVFAPPSNGTIGWYRVVLFDQSLLVEDNERVYRATTNAPSPAPPQPVGTSNKSEIKL